jgi:ribosome maturation factor RimP
MMTTESTAPSPTGAPRGVGQRMRAQVLADAIEPVIEAMGYELVHLDWSSSGARHKLQVFVDGPDGIGLDDCTRLSPIISNALDAGEAADPAGPLARLLGGAYVLEVSSPGLDRPLSKRSQFERFAGQRARIRTFEPLHSGSDQRTFHGRIGTVEADPADPDDDRMGTVVLTDQDSGTPVRISLSLIRRAHLVYEA